RSIFFACPSISASICATKSDFNGLLSSLRFEGLLNNRRYNVGELISDIEELENETNRLVQRLRKQVSDLGCGDSDPDRRTMAHPLRPDVILVPVARWPRYSELWSLSLIF
ncbi:MAG: hypothetical protein WBP60_08475, partial [Gammaproteobacteria bacterium]